MLTRDDLVDIIVAGLSKDGPAAVSAKGPKGRRFLSEHDIKKRLTAGGKRLTIPMNSIVSPLALDWLTLQGIEIVPE
ncbi:MAG: hypothetical protein A2506_02505 [Elusimicrobia bacterium RIFOXYD12_FULL_66_9]|nr:MAG: hypothetical protein A2506_02505 [Elusimicrobia bacterium RIFOXYD12_FULL_66_9]